MSPVLDRAHVHADKLGDVGPADTVSEEHERLCAPRDTLFESALPKQRLAVGALCGRERERDRLATGMRAANEGRGVDHGLLYGGVYETCPRRWREELARPTLAPRA